MPISADKPNKAAKLNNHATMGAYLFSLMPFIYYGCCIPIKTDRKPTWTPPYSDFERWPAGGN
jgi:hypothetical protein